MGVDMRCPCVYNSVLGFPFRTKGEVADVSLECIGASSVTLTLCFSRPD